MLKRFLDPCTEGKIIDMIQDLPNNKCPVPNGFSAKFYIKKYLDVIKTPMISLYKGAFDKGILPSSLKSSNIILILQKVQGSRIGGII